MKEEKAQLFLGYYGLLLFVVFIGFQWTGIIVTLLWLLTAIILFVAGVRLKSIAMRLSAMALIGVTLLKLVVFDSLHFSTLQKVIAYILLGVLLLVVSFFIRRHRHERLPVVSDDSLSFFQIMILLKHVID